MLIRKNTPNRIFRIFYFGFGLPRDGGEGWSRFNPLFGRMGDDFVIHYLIIAWRRLYAANYRLSQDENDLRITLKGFA